MNCSPTVFFRLLRLLLILVHGFCLVQGFHHLEYAGTIRWFDSVALVHQEHVQ